MVASEVANLSVETVVLEADSFARNDALYLQSQCLQDQNRRDVRLRPS